MRALLVCLLALASVSCKDDSSDEPIAVVDFCPALALALCEGIQACCVEESIATMPCLAREASFCQSYLLSADDRAGTSGQDVLNRVVIEFDEEGAGRAVGAIKSAAAGCTEVAYPRFAEVHALHEEGELCETDEHCLEQLECVQQGGTFGTCARAPRAGQACRSRCELGLLCVADGDGGRICSPPRREGQSCTSQIECEAGTYCAGSVIVGMGAQGVCAGQARNGVGCTSDIECASLYCAEETVCNDPPSDDAASTWCASAALSSP